MTQIISLTSNKGGTGKTTLTLGLAAAMAERKKKVLMVDLDQQGSMTRGAGYQLPPNAPHIGHLLTGDSTWEQTIVTGTSEYLHLIPSAMTLVRYEKYLDSERDTDWVLSELLAKHATDYDYVFLDCPPNTGIMTFMALTAATYYIVPMQGESFAYQGLDSIRGVVNIVRRKTNTDLRMAGVVLNKFETNTILGRTILEAMNNADDVHIFNTRIRKDIQLAEAEHEGQSIFSFDPKSRGAKDMADLASELAGSIERMDTPVANA